MARIRLRFVNSFRNKNRGDGRVRYYFRRGRTGKAIPLPGIPGDEQFMSAYHAALASTSNTPAEIGAARTAPGSVDALIVTYYKSTAWLKLAEDSKKNRRYLIERFRERHGSKRVALLRRDHFEKMLAEMTVSPGMKRHWLETIRTMLKSGIPSMIASDPTAGIVVNRPKTPGHRPWTVEQIEQYRARWALGTQARLVMEFAYQTVSRRGEVCRLGPQHLYRGQNGEWRIKIARTKGSRDVDILVSPELLAAVQAMPRDHLTYLVNQNGKALSKDTLGFRFRHWATEAGLPKHCRMHGLKKSGMAEIVLAGASAPELMAVSGHRSMTIAQAYVEETFKRPELADAALGKVRTKRDGAYTNKDLPLHKHPANPLKKQGT
jgi:integrase